MEILLIIIVTFFAGMGAGLGTGFAGMSAAAKLKRSHKEAQVIVYEKSSHISTETRFVAETFDALSENDKKSVIALLKEMKSHR